MQFPLLTNELADRIEQADLDVMVGRLLAAQKREGNPLQIQIRQFGGATAMLTPGIPIIDFNKVHFVGPAEIGLLDEIIEFFASNGLKQFGIDIVPSRTSPELLQAMDARGMYQEGFHTAFYGVPMIEEMATREGVTVREIEEHEVPLLTQLFVDSFKVPPGMLTSETKNIQGLFGHPEWKLYLAHVDGNPSGFAMLHHRKGVSCLALAGTIDEWRGRGVQTALLERRLLDSKQLGCELVTAQASYGSSSFRNMLRMGLQVAFTKAAWTWKQKNL